MKTNEQSISSLESNYRLFENWLIDVIKKTYPDWVNDKGNCPKCFEYYRRLGNNITIEI